MWKTHQTHFVLDYQLYPSTTLCTNNSDWEIRVPHSIICKHKNTYRNTPDLEAIRVPQNEQKWETDTSIDVFLIESSVCKDWQVSMLL